MTKKKPHPADIADRAKIATATHFNVHLRRNPGDVVNQEAATLIEAIKIAADMGVEPNGKKPMIYAVTPDRQSVFVPNDMLEAAIAPELTDGEKEIVEALDKPAKPIRKAKDSKPKSEEPKAEVKPLGKRAAILEAAQRGELPAEPDFSAETHKRFRPKLAEVVALAQAGDLTALKAIEINPVSSSPKAIAKYRELAVIALEARA